MSKWNKRIKIGYWMTMTRLVLKRTPSVLALADRSRGGTFCAVGESVREVDIIRGLWRDGGVYGHLRWEGLVKYTFAAPLAGNGGG